MGLNPKNPVRATTKKTVIDPFSAAALQAAAETTEIGKAMKGSTLEFEGDIARQGIDTDQIKKVEGEGAQSFDASFLESASSITSARQQERIAIANFEAKQAAIKASKLQAIEKNEITKEMKNVIQEKQKLNEDQANEKLLKFADAQEELDNLEGKTLWERTKDFFSTFATPGSPIPNYGLMALGAQNLIYGGMNAKEEKKYNELQKYKKKEIEPVLDLTSARIDERYKSALEKADVLRQQKLKDDAQPVFNQDGTVGPKASVRGALGFQENTTEDNYMPYAEENYWRVAASKYEDMKEKISDYKTGNTDFFAGISTTSKDVFSLGLKPFWNDIRAKEIVDKKERIYAAEKKGQVPTESLSDAENAVLEAYALEGQVQQLKLHENNFGYNLGEGVGGSLGFMAQMILTRGAGTVAKQAVTSALRQGVKQEVKLGLRSLIKENIKKGTLSSLTKTGTELGIRSTAATAGILAQAPLSPMFYKAYASDQVGQVEIVKDKNGVEKILVGQELYDEKSENYKEQLQALDQLIERETDPARKEDFESKKLHLQAEWDSMIPKSEVSSLMHATGEYFKEAFSEAYAGRGLGAALKQGGKGLRYVAAKSPFLTKVADNFGVAGEVLAKINSPFRKINNAVNNLTLGRISAAQIGQKAEGGLIQSIPEETFEEIFVQAVPSLGRTSAENQVQREELGNLSFYRDVMAQTAIMGLGFGFVGKVAAAKAYARDKTDYKKLLKSLSLTDEEQKALGFTTGNKLVSPKDYRRLSSKFREQGKDLIADQIEQRMFINMAYQAARLGKMDSYKESIEALKTRKDIPVSFITNAVAVSNQVETINDAYQKHSEKENFNEILEATVYQGLHEDNLKKLESQTSPLQENARAAIEDYKARTGKSFDYSIENLLTKEFETEEEQKQYKQILGELLDEENGSLAVQNLVGNIEMKRAARIAISENSQKLDLALSPKRQEKLEAKKLLREEYELIEKDLESGELVLPGVELQFDYNNNLNKKSLASVNVAEAIIKHIEENYKDVVSQEDLQELKMQKIERAKAERENAMAELLIAQSQKIEDGNKVDLEDATQPQDPFNSNYDPAPDPSKYEDDTELPATAVNTDPVLDQVFGLASQGFQADSPEVTTVEPVEPVVTKTADEQKQEIEAEKQEELNGYSVQTRMIDAAFQANAREFKPKPYPSKDYDYPKEITHNGVVYKLGDTVNDHFTVTNTETGFQTKHTHTAIYNITDPKSTQYRDRQEELDKELAKVEAKYQEKLKQVVIPINNSTSSVNAAGAIQIDQDGFIFEGEPMIGKTYPPEFVEEMERLLESSTQLYEESTNNRITFREIFEYYKSNNNHQNMKKNFGAMMQAWINLNAKHGDKMYPMENFLETFNSIYTPLGVFDVLDIDPEPKPIPVNQGPVMPTTHPDVEVREENEKIAQTALVSSVIVGQDDSNRDVVQEVVEITIDGHRTSNVLPKIGYSSLEYTEQNVDGTYSKVSVPILDPVKKNGVDITPLIDPDGLQSGDTLSIEVADEKEWKDITVSNGRDDKGIKQLTTFAEWVAEKSKVIPNFRSTQEFQDKLPIYYTYQGKRVGSVNDTDWYDGYNVQDPNGLDINPHRPTGEWAETIASGKQNTQKLRSEILNKGLKQVTVKKAPSSVVHRVEKDALVTIADNNPTSILVVQMGEGVTIGNKEPFKDGVILNEEVFKERTVENGKNKLTHEGKTWELRREGKKQMPDGTFVNTYRAWGVSRRVTDEQLETVKWALGANAVLSNSYLTNSTEWTSLTKDQAERIREDILNNTGLDISLPNELLMFVESYLQLKDKPKRGATKENGKPYTTYMYYQDQFLKNNLGIDSEGVEYVQHTKQELLNKRGYKSAVHIIDGQVEPLNMSYSDYLKNTLKTDVLSFNIGTEEKPIYVTGIQPIINITYNGVEENPKTEASAVVEKAIETPATESVDFTDQYEFAATLNLDIDTYLEFEEGEAMLANNLDPIQKLVTSIAGLTTPQEQDVRQYVTQAIAEYKQYVDEEGRILKRNKRQIQAEAKAKLLADLMQVKQALQNNLSIVKSTNADTAEKRAFEKAYSEALTNIDSIEKEFNLLFDRALEDFEKSSKTEIEEEEVEDALNEKNYNKDSVEENSKLSVGTVLKNFLHGVVKRDSKGVPQTGYLGIEQYYTFNEIFNELTKLLTLGSDLPSSYEALSSRLRVAAENGAPFAKDVLLKLEQADNQIKNQFLYTFVKHSMSSYFTMYQQVGNVSEMKSFETNANEATRVIENKWKNNNRTSELYNRNLTINTETAQDLLNTYNSWITEGKSTPEDHRKWLSRLGVSFTDAAWDKIVAEGIKDKGYTYDNILYDDSRGIFKPIADFLSNALGTPEKFMFSEDKNIFKDLSAMFKSVAKIEASYNTNLVSLTYRDGDKNIFTQTPETFMSDKVNDLLDSLAQDGNTLVDDLRGLSFSESSIILEFLQEVSSFKDIFKMSHAAIVTLKEKGEDSNDRSSITDLGELDYDINVNGQFGDRKIKQLTTTEKINGIAVRVMRMLCPTMSDKSKAYYLDTIGLDLLQGNELIASGKEDVLMSDKLKETLVDKLIMPEVNRILNYYNKVKQTNIKDYDEGATKFHLISALNTLKNKDGVSILTEMATVPNLTPELIKQAYGNAFKDIITNVVDAEAAKKKELWKDQFVEGVGSKMFGANYFTEVKKSPVTDYTKGIYDVVINGMLHNSEMFKVFAGDMALYSQAKLYKIETESSKANTSENKVPEYKDIEDFTTEDWVSINRGIGVNLGKRLAALAAPGNKIAGSADPNFRQYNQIFLQDSVDIAPNAGYLITLEYGKQALTPKVKEMLSDYTKHAETVHQYQIGNTVDFEKVAQAQSAMKETRGNLQKMFPAIDSYFDIESTDAQEYTTVKEHINILNRQGRLTDKKLKAIEEKLDAGKDLTREELKVVMQPIKPVHTGSYANKDMDVNRFVYVKSSSYPLLPQFTKGTKLDGLRVKMEELEKSTKRFTRASFQTANKVGSVNTKLAINPFDMYSLATINESNTDAIVVLDRNNFRIQQDVPIKSEKTKADKISMGTQFFKLLFGDGITELDGFKIDGQEFTGRELHKYYTEAFSELAKQKRTELFEELGLSANGEVEDKKEFIYSLQKLLVKEAKSRGYSLKSIAGLSIDELAMANGYFYEFKTPLWLSSDKNRYESLLNSIVTNRLMQYKISGNAYVAGSESGIQFKEGIDSIKDLDERTQSRVIYLNNFNGKELGGTEVTEEDGSTTFKKAQVFIRSYFKNPATGELINLFEGFNSETGDVSNSKYLIRRENGTLGLKEGMIDENLFNMFSFRTPTSSHVSGASIEIAGILPPEMGELMIVPKNFTKQKGLDFDVDKENTYQLNHFIDEEGNIKEVNEEYRNRIEDSVKELKFYRGQDYQSIQEVEQALSELEGRLKVATNMPYRNELESEIEGLWASLKDSKTSIKDINHAMRGIQRELNTKIASQLSENKFIKAHLAVFNNPDNKVQKKINKVLSMSFAQDQASMFEKAVEEGNKAREIAKSISFGMTPAQAEKEYFDKQSYNTVLSYSYQKMKMDLGSIGKTAIGVYANYTTMNGLIQQQTENISLNQPITIGGVTSTGKLGVLDSLKPSNISQSVWDKMKLGRSTAEIFAEKENTATDNEKEQILGRVGVNDQTINVDALLTLLGFDIDLVKVPGVNELQKMSLSYLLLSQPSIKEYNKKVKDSQGILGDFLNKKALKKEMVEKLSDGQITFGKDPKKSKYATNNPETFRYAKSGEIYNAGASLTGQNLYDSIAKKPNGMVQADALITYFNLDAQAREVSKVQKILNTNDLGKSMVESRVTYDALAELPYTTIKNATSLLGKFEINPKVITDDMYKIGGHYVTPTTPQGHVAIHGLQVGNTLFKSFFPYDDMGIKSVVNQILTAQGLDLESISDRVYVKEFHKIMEEMIKYINSNPNNNTFAGNPREKRIETFVDSDTNTSLSTYLRDLGSSTTNKKGVNSVLKNALYTRFSFTTGAEGELSLIKYNNTSTDNLDEEVLYNALPELILSNYPLPDRNGKPYSTKQLAEDLVAYSFLEGGVQEATQFSKFIPVQLLEVMGQMETRNDKEMFVPINKKLQMFNNRNNTVGFFNSILGVQEYDIASFTRQYFQNNSKKAKRAWSKNVKFTEDGILLYETKQGKSPKFITNTTIEDNVKVTRLYENMGGNAYRQLDIVGQAGIKEYYYKQDQITSLFNEENVIEAPGPIMPPTSILDSLTMTNLTTPEDLLAQIQTMNFGKDKQYLAETAKWLIPLLKTGKVTVRLSDTLPGGIMGHTSRPDSKGQIVISLSSTQMDNMSKDKGAELILHEVLHSVAVSHLTEYFDSTGMSLKSEVAIPAHVQGLYDAFSAARVNYEDEIAELEEKIAHNSIKSNPQLPYTEREMNVIYGLTNIFEFVSVSMTSEDFQKEFKDAPFDTNKSIFNKIEEFILGMLDNFFPDLKKNTIARQSILASMNFIQEERIKATPKTQVQPIMPSANVGVVYGKYVEIPINERVSQKYPNTIELEGHKMDTKTLVGLSQLKEAAMYGPFFDWNRYDNQSEEELTLEEVQEALEKEYGPAALEFAWSKWGEDISVAELEFLRDNPVEGNKILDAWADLEDSDVENDNILPYFADNILKEVPEEYIDKNQTKLFSTEIAVENLREQEQEELKKAFPNAVETNGKIEKSSLTTEEDKAKFDEIYDKFDKLITPLLKQIEEGENMISNNLLTFDNSIEALGITEEEWNGLSLEEKDRIIKCS